MNEVISRIKNSIDTSIIDKVDKSAMGKMKFVPISIRQGQLFVAVSKKSNMDRISQLLKKYYPNPIRFMPVGGDDDLQELLSDFIPNSDEKDDTPKFPQKKRCPGYGIRTNWRNVRGVIYKKGFNHSGTIK